MSPKRSAVTTVEPVETLAQQIERLEADRLDLLRERARDVPGADARLDGIEREIEKLRRQPDRDQAQAAVLAADAAAQAQADAAAERRARAADLATATATWREQTRLLDEEVTAGVVRVERVERVLAAAKTVYTLTLTVHGKEHRAARAANERVAEFVALRLGLAIPWPIEKCRRTMGLLQILGFSEREE